MIQSMMIHEHPDIDDACSKAAIMLL